MLKFILCASVALWVVTGDSIIGRAVMVGIAIGAYYLVRWARK
jgi:hypothetical protein